jgi:hypothetical protein
MNIYLKLPGLAALMATYLAAQVHFSQQSDRVVIEVDGKPFSNLYYGKEVGRPFLHPLNTASGKPVTRGYPVTPLPGEAHDRPHQRGIWMGAERLSGSDYWENDPTYDRKNKAKIVFEDVTEAKGGSASGVLGFSANWIDKDGKLVMVEKQRLTFYAGKNGTRTFDIDTTLTARQEVTFEDYDDATLGMRLGTPFEEKSGGVLKNAAGRVNEAGVRGQRSEWLDWTAELAGEKVGVAVFDHPANPNSPTRWHVRANGVLIASTFGQQVFDKNAPSLEHTVKKGEALRLRFRVMIHPAVADVARAYQQYVTEAAGRERSAL